MDPNLRKKLTAGLIVLAVPLTGGVAYAVADSIDTQPDSEVIIPAESRRPAATAPATAGTQSDSTGATTPGVSGTTATTVPTTPMIGDDVPVIAEQPPATVDDHGGDRGPGGGGADDGPGHDAGDDRGGGSGSGRSGPG